MTTASDQPTAPSRPTRSRSSRHGPTVHSIADNAHVDGTYDASSIQVLEGLEAVRKRPGMYIGSTGERGLHHLVTRWSTTPSTRRWPATATGSTSRCWPTAASGSSTTAAASRSTRSPSEGRPAVEVVLTVLHAGGKFGGGGYKVSGGLHGVGVSVVNALSRRLDVEVRPRRLPSGPSPTTVGVPERRSRKGGRDRRDRHHDHVLGRRRHLRDHRLRLRDAVAPASRRWRSSTRA